MRLKRYSTQRRDRAENYQDRQWLFNSTNFIVGVFERAIFFILKNTFLIFWDYFNIFKI